MVGSQDRVPYAGISASPSIGKLFVRLGSSAKITVKTVAVCTRDVDQRSVCLSDLQHSGRLNIKYRSTYIHSVSDTTAILFCLIKESAGPDRQNLTILRVVT